jgi:hypothetical protein
VKITLQSGRSSGVEHNLAKVRVGRSNRLARSNKIRHLAANPALKKFSSKHCVSRGRDLERVFGVAGIRERNLQRPRR